jgi:hypothetical protein
MARESVRTAMGRYNRDSLLLARFAIVAIRTGAAKAPGLRHA